MESASRSLDVMGGTVELLAYGLQERGSGEIFADLIRLEAMFEKVFNFFDPESELSRLNRDRVARVSPHLLKVLQKAVGYSVETDGGYDVSLGRAFYARKQGRNFTPRCSYLDLDISGDVVSLNHVDVLVDLGSIAKGYIVDRLVDRMRSLGVESGLVDARGDISVFGENVEVVDVVHPREPGEAVRSLVLDNCCVATSGDYRQFWRGFDTSHLIGCGFFSSVTVVADSLFEADALATCVSVLDLEDAGAFLSRHGGARVFACGKDLSEHEFNGIESIYPEVYVDAA